MRVYTTDLSTEKIYVNLMKISLTAHRRKSIEHLLFTSARIFIIYFFNREDVLVYRLTLELKINCTNQKCWHLRKMRLRIISVYKHMYIYIFYEKKIC